MPFVLPRSLPRSYGSAFPPRSRLVGLVAVCALASGLSSGRAAACTPVPATLVAGRFLIAFETSSGRRFTALSDTGGGGTILSRSTADRLGVTIGPAPEALRAELGPEAGLAEAPEVSDAFPPLPSPTLIVPEVGPAPGWPEALDAVVGHDWFAGRQWTWDYATGLLSLDCEPSGRELVMSLPASDAPPPFKQFPRITVVVAGEPIAVLFDTGASTWLTPEALETLADGGPTIRASSMITASRVAAWRRDHPEWRVIEGAQHGTRATMIEARDVEVDGIQVGSVWFTERPDQAFVGMLSSTMAGPVEGAVGGNAFRGLRITVDYRSQRGWIARP